MAKAMLVMFLSVILVCTLFIEEAEAKAISRGAMRQGGVKCGPHPCPLPKTGTGWQRGCEPEERCRGTPPSRSKREDEDIYKKMAFPFFLSLQKKP